MTGRRSRYKIIGNAESSKGKSKDEQQDIGLNNSSKKVTRMTARRVNIDEIRGWWWRRRLVANEEGVPPPPLSHASVLA